MDDYISKCNCMQVFDEEEERRAYYLNSLRSLIFRTVRGKGIMCISSHIFFRKKTPPRASPDNIFKNYIEVYF